jgi:3-hydroxybutyryl-CoA dehydrogenase
MAVQDIGVAGLGLLGRGIAACLLGYGYRVTTFEPNPATRDLARDKIGAYIDELVAHGVTDAATDAGWRGKHTEAAACEELGGCDLVIESVVEDLQIKHRLYQDLESVADPAMPIASNTSAIPISVIQNTARHPQRFVGMHWGEPAHIMVYMEITRGEHTDDTTFDAVVKLARAVGKQPALVQRDIRGFLGNRYYYALLREAFYLLESGVASIDDIDLSFRSALGWWALFTGPFRNMDLTGIEAHARVMKDLFPELCNSTEVPATIQRIVDEGRAHTGTLHGFYNYTPEDLERWEAHWDPFIWDIRALAAKYEHLHQRPSGENEQETASG